MEYKEGRLGYNRKNDRYGLLVTDLSSYSKKTPTSKVGDELRLLPT